jgi:hypothetical protein
MEEEALQDGGTKKQGDKPWNCTAVAHQVMLQAVQLKCLNRIVRQLWRIIRN